MSRDHPRPDSNHLSSFVILFSFPMLVLDSIDVQLRWQFTKEGRSDDELPWSIRRNDDHQAQETKTCSIGLSPLLLLSRRSLFTPVDADDDEDSSGKRAEIDWVVCLYVRSVEQHRICDWHSHLFTAAFFFRIPGTEVRASEREKKNMRGKQKKSIKNFHLRFTDRMNEKLVLGFFRVT